MTIGVYVITFKETGKRYVGQSTNVGQRISNLLLGTSNMYVKEAYNGKTRANIKINIIECERSELDELEQFLIEECNSIYPNGYNIQSGGRRGWTEPNKNHEKNKK